MAGCTAVVCICIHHPSWWLCRALLSAASSGDVDRAQDILDQMSEAGLEPGPRAIHVLLFSYVKAKMAREALEVARRCREQGKCRPLSGRALVA